MSLTFVNHYSFTAGHDVWVAFMRLDRTACSGGDGFNAIGWYQIPAGGSMTVYTGDVSYNRYWAYYAESHDGYTWNGNITAWVSNSAFQLCHGNVCTPCRQVGFRQLDVGSFTNYTLTLTV